MLYRCPEHFWKTKLVKDYRHSGFVCKSNSTKQFGSFYSALTEEWKIILPDLSLNFPKYEPRQSRPISLWLTACLLCNHTGNRPYRTLELSYEKQNQALDFHQTNFLSSALSGTVEDHLARYIIEFPKIWTKTITANKSLTDSMLALSQSYRPFWYRDKKGSQMVLITDPKPILFL